MSLEDKAQELELAMWSMRNERTVPQDKHYAPEDAGYGPAECSDCMDNMPDVRRAYGYKLCTACQEAIDKKLRRPW